MAFEDEESEEADEFDETVPDYVYELDE